MQETLPSREVTETATFIYTEMKYRETFNSLHSALRQKSGILGFCRR
jgi:hypothetical protein